MIPVIIVISLSILFYILTFYLLRIDKKYLFFLIIIGISWGIISPFIPVYSQIIISFFISLFISIYYKKFITINNNSITFFIFMALYIIIMTVLPSLIYYAFNYSMLDFGNMLQPIYNTAHGHFMLLSRPWGNINRYSMHQEFIYLLFVPFIRIFPSGLVLIFFQTLFIAFGGFAVYKIANLYLNKTKSVLFGILYLLSPLLSYINLFSIHGDAFAISLILFSIYFYLKGKNNYFLLFSLLAMMCKEYIAFIYIFFAVLIVIEKKYKLSIITFFISIFYYFIFLKFIKHFTGSSNFIESMHYSHNLLQLIKNIFILFKWKNIILIFAMFLFIPLYNWKWLIPTLPIFAGILLSKYSGVANIKTHHFATIYPFLFTAVILFFKNKNEINIFKFKLSLETFFLFSIVFYFYTGPTSLDYRFYHPKEYYYCRNIQTYKITSLDKNILKEIQKFKNPKYKIATTPNLASHLCMRTHITLLKWGNKKQILNSDYVIYSEREIFLSKDRFRRMKDDFLFVRENPNFKLIEKSPLIIYKHK